MGFILVFIFLGMPIIEIVAFIKVGSLIGLAPTLALTIVTAIAGAALVRYQGFRTLLALKQTLDNGQLPLEAAIHASFLLIAGLCLLTPGFVTDTIGFFLLVPPARIAVARRIWRYLNRHGEVTIVAGQYQPSASPHHDSGPVIDLEAQEIDDCECTQMEQRPLPPRKNGGTTR